MDGKTCFSKIWSQPLLVDEHFYIKTSLAFIFIRFSYVINVVHLSSIQLLIIGCKLSSDRVGVHVFIKDFFQPLRVLTFDQWDLPHFWTMLGAFRGTLQSFFKTPLPTKLMIEWPFLLSPKCSYYQLVYPS